MWHIDAVEFKYIKLVVVKGSHYGKPVPKYIVSDVTEDKIIMSTLNSHTFYILFTE